MTFSVDSVILLNKFIPFALLFALSALSGCGARFHVRENLTREQIVDPAIIRKATGKKTLGLLPVYEELFEGYIRGGIIGVNGQKIGGVLVKVADKNGAEVPGFQTGVTDEGGIYKIRFSLPLRWGELDSRGILTVDPKYRILDPEPEFHLYFSRRNGVLAYSTKMVWFTVQDSGGRMQPGEVQTGVRKPGKGAKPSLFPEAPAAPAAMPASKPAEKGAKDDFFGDFDFK